MSQETNNHSGDGDIVGGDKISKGINLVNSSNNHISSFITNHNHFFKENLSEEDKKEFENDVNNDAIRPYKNLISRIGFHLDEYEFQSARDLINDAKTVWHKYHTLLLYDAYTLFVTSSSNQLIIKDDVIRKIKNLILLAKKQKEDKLYFEICEAIAETFYDFIVKNVDKLHKDSLERIKNFRDNYKFYDYYYAMLRWHSKYGHKLLLFLQNGIEQKTCKQRTLVRSSAL